MTGTARIGQTPGTLTLVGLLAASLAFACGGWSAMGEEPPEELPPIEFDANPPTGFSPYPYMEEPIITEPVEGTVWAVGTEHELVCSPPYDSDTLEGCDPDSKEDHVTVWWGCSGGQFKIPDYGEPLYPFGHIGTPVTWVAPETPGTITFDCTADDDHYYSAQTQDHYREYYDYCIANDMTTEAEPVEVWIVRVDIDIWNGQTGPMAPETDHNGDGVEDEADIGAFTVANLNDTNGDTTPDKDQNPVLANGANGRDEIDLMRLVIRPPGTAELTGKVRLVIEAGDVAIWDHEHKSSPNPITDYEVDIGDLPVTWWVEARSATSLRGIKLRCEVQPTGKTGWYCPDKVTATGIWASCTDIVTANHTPEWVRDHFAGHNTDVTYTGSNPDARVQVLGGTGVRGRHNVVVPEFRVTPHDIATAAVPLLYGDGATPARPRFDVSRQIEGAVIVWPNDSPIAGLYDRAPYFGRIDGHALNPKFPENRTPARDNEWSNDDASEEDETDEPGDEGYIWSMDGPGGGGGEFLATLRANFKEFLRMGVNGNDPGDGVYGARGSRCSGYQKWYSKTNAGAVTTGREVGTGHMSFTEEPLHAEAPDTLTAGTRHHGVMRGLVLSTGDGPNPAPPNQQQVTLKLMDDDWPDADELLDYVSGIVPVGRRAAGSPSPIDTRTNEGDLLAYTGTGYLGSRLNRHVVGPDGTSHQTSANVVHRIGDSSTKSPAVTVAGANYTLPTPTVGAMDLGEITTVECTGDDRIRAEADANNGGVMEVTVEIDDYDSFPYVSDTLDDLSPVTNVPRLMVDEKTGANVNAIRRALVNRFAIPTGRIASNKTGKVIGPDGSSGDTTAHICVYVKDYDGNWHRSGYVARTGTPYSRAAPNISVANPIGLGVVANVTMDVYVEATDTSGTESAQVRVMDDDNTIWDTTDDLLDEVTYTMERPQGCFVGACIGPMDAPANPARIRNTDGTITSADGTRTSGETIAEVVYEIGSSASDSPATDAEAEQP